MGIEIPQPADLTFSDYLEEHTIARPDAFALHYFSRSWTYSQANADANKLANGLSELGVGSGKVPKRVTFIDEIPLTPVGKIDKKKLRAAAIALA